MMREYGRSTPWRTNGVGWHRRYHGAGLTVRTYVIRGQIECWTIVSENCRDITVTIKGISSRAKAMKYAEGWVKQRLEELS